MSDKGIESLSVNQLKMLKYIFEGDRYWKAYKRAFPNSKATDESLHVLATIERKKIIETLGGNLEFFKAGGLGPERIMKVIDDAMEAEKVVGVVQDEGGNPHTITEKDYKIRLQASKQLADIHGLSQTNVNVSGHVDHEYKYDFVKLQQQAMAEIEGEKKDD